MKRVVVIAALLSYFSTLSANARDFKPRTVRLVINHTTGIVEAQTLGGRQLDATSLKNPETLELRASQNVEVILREYNPLLFQYEWNGVTYTDNTTYKIIQDFGKSLKAVAGKLESGEVGAVERVNVVDFNEQIRKLREYVDLIPSLVRQSVSDVPGVKQRVNGWELEKIESAVNDFYSQLTNNSAPRQSLIPTSQGQGTPAEQPPAEQPPAEQPPAAQPKSPTGAPVASGGLSAGAAEPFPTGNSGTSGDSQDLSAQEGTRFALLRSDIKDMLETAKSFRATVNSINREKVLGTVSYDVARDAVATVKISPSPRYSEIATATDRVTGEVRFPIVPRYPAVLELGAAAVYSFIESPEFSPEKQPDGTFKIARKDSDYVGLNAAAMLTITPRPWAESPIRGAFQVGVSPVKDEVGLFGGVQLRLINIASLSLGYVYQQVKRLKNGVNVGDSIGGFDEIKTEPHFTGGGYVGITVNMP